MNKILSIIRAQWLLMCQYENIKIEIQLQTHDGIVVKRK